MTPAELRSICDKLNPGGQSKLARMISVSPRTMRRWIAGKVEIPALIDLAISKSLELADEP
jgi:DNA-binding transcriptional regulator YdaS (Cro superfamily)